MRFSAERAFESLRHDAEHEATKGPNHAGGRASYPSSPTAAYRHESLVNAARPFDARSLDQLDRAFGAMSNQGLR
jgi:hypothetical protein